MRRVLTRFFRTVLRIFFRHIEVAGEENVPSEAPILFVLNHSNGLVDPLFILCLSPRRVSFLAKAPLFETPVVRWFVRSFECLPVYRKEDQADTAKNRETLEARRETLERGNAIALFPEGTSHSDPELRPLKTGAARIALSANAHRAGLEPVRIVPAGLYYSDKGTFRSRASLVYGEGIVVPRVTLDEELRPPASAVRDLTEAIDASLRSVTLNAGAMEAIETARLAEAIFSAASRDLEPESGRPSLAVVAELNLRRRLTDGYEALEREHPGALRSLTRRIHAYIRLLDAHGLSTDHPARLGAAIVLPYSLRGLFTLVLLAPLALPGAALNAPAYLLTHYISTRVMASEADVTSTVKVLASLLFYPLSWGALALVLGLEFGAPVAALALLLGPLSAWAALVATESSEGLMAGARALGLYFRHREEHDYLVAERGAIREEILELAAKLPEAP